MKLSEDQAATVKAQLGADPIPSDEPAVGQLTEAFGDHTFYLDANGLIIFEETEDENDAARAVVVAVWADDDKTQLGGIDPHPTDTVVDFAGGGDSAA